MLDLNVEQPISLAAAAVLVPPARSGKRTAFQTILRWVTCGAKGPGGVRVRLEAIRLGGRWMTSHASLQRFAERLTPRLDTVSGETPRTPTRRAQAAGRAGKELDQIGI